MDQMPLELRSQSTETEQDWRDTRPELPVLDEGRMLQRKLAFQEALVAMLVWEKEIHHLEAIVQLAQPQGAPHGPTERIEELKRQFVARFEQVFLGDEAVVKLPSRRIFESYRKFKDDSDK